MGRTVCWSAFCEWLDFGISAEISLREAVFRPYEYRTAFRSRDLRWHAVLFSYSRHGFHGSCFIAYGE